MSSEPDEPDQANASRPNRTRSTVLQIRLNSEEFEALEQMADELGLPVSIVARDGVLEMINADRRSRASKGIAGATAKLVFDMQAVAAEAARKFLVQLGENMTAREKR